VLTRFPHPGGGIFSCGCSSSASRGDGDGLRTARATADGTEGACESAETTGRREAGAIQLSD